MAYKTEDLKKKAIAAIKEHNLFFVDDVVAFLPCNSKTFYNHGLQNLQELKDLLAENRIKVKLKLRKKWGESDNATLQMALMKLICTDDERKRLSMEYKEEEHKGEIIITRRIINGRDKPKD